jgi:polyhydroxyalkanoate synthesis regulator phasin
MAAPGSGALAELLQLVDELGARLRREAVNLADVPQEQAARVGRELGFVTREELQALELRLAQLEHRLKLLEQP